MYQGVLGLYLYNVNLRSMAEVTAALSGFGIEQTRFARGAGIGVLDLVAAQMAEALAERAALAAALNFWAPCAALTEEETCSDPGVIPANRIFLLGGCPDSPAVESKESSVVVEATLVISRGDRGDWTAGSAWPTP